MTMKPLTPEQRRQAGLPAELRVVSVRRLHGNVHEVVTESAKYGRVTQTVLMLPRTDGAEEPAGPQPSTSPPGDIPMTCPCDQCECGVCPECERRRGICRVREERSAVTPCDGPPGPGMLRTTDPRVVGEVERFVAASKARLRSDLFEMAWYAALGVLAVAALAVLLGAGWWPR